MGRKGRNRYTVVATGWEGRQGQCLHVWGDTEKCSPLLRLSERQESEEKGQRSKASSTKETADP
jgi:hypothetical protein